jgi:hypothetical protein
MFPASKGQLSLIISALDSGIRVNGYACHGEPLRVHLGERVLMRLLKC